MIVWRNEGCYHGQDSPHFHREDGGKANRTIYHIGSHKLGLDFVARGQAV